MTFGLAAQSRIMSVSDAVTRNLAFSSFIADLDGTLTQSKQRMTQDMAEAIATFLTDKPAAIISGCAFAQFEEQVFPAFDEVSSCNLANLILLPTRGAAFYERKYDSWKKVYDEAIPADDAEEIKKSIALAVYRSGVVLPDIPKEYGDRYEYRGSQVTLSACGQKAPIDVKKAWDPDATKRRLILKELYPLLSNTYGASYGGTTSIDVNKKGIDKAYGIQKYAEHTGIPIESMLYIGDALQPGGNDEAALRTGILCVEVSGPGETLRLLKHLAS